MQRDGKRLKEKGLPAKLLWNEGLAASLAGWPQCEEKAIGRN
jgi:hypothetical protein